MIFLTICTFAIDYYSFRQTKCVWHYRSNEKDLNLIKHFIKEESQMNKEILSRKSHETMTDFEEEVYEVSLTGATISSTSSVALLHRYCSKLPHDEYALKTQYIYEPNFATKRLLG